jgi:chromosome transmission fidelity protein 1
MFSRCAALAAKKTPRRAPFVSLILLFLLAAAPSGAVLLAVVNGKLSEGINFADDLCRCVMVVGMPFGDRRSGVLRQRMAYFDDLYARGQTQCNGEQLYTNLCMRAVNQSIGRAFRNIDDYAVVILFDERYERFQHLLPDWVRRRFYAQDDWEDTLHSVEAFFDARRAKKK